MLGLEMTMEEKGEKRVRLEVLATGGGMRGGVDFKVQC
jgi:hypothetical protein